MSATSVRATLGRRKVRVVRGPSCQRQVRAVSVAVIGNGRITSSGPGTARAVVKRRCANASSSIEPSGDVSSYQVPGSPQHAHATASPAQTSAATEARIATTRLTGRRLRLIRGRVQDGGLLLADRGPA